MSPMDGTGGGCPSGDERVILLGRLFETNARLARDLGAVLEAACELNLASFEALLRLHRAEGRRLKMNEVASAIVHSSGGTTRLVDRLESSGLVERQICPSDRRATFVALTPLGDAKLAAALAVHAEFIGATLASRLDESERGVLSGLLEKLDGR